MTTVETFVPEGFVDGPTHPMVSVALSSRLNRVGPRGGPQRVAAVLKDGAEEAAKALFAENPMWTAKRKAPGVYELLLTGDELAALTARADLFTWFDASSRLHGERLADPAATAVFTIHTTDTKGAREAVAAAGGHVAGQAADGSMKGSITASQLGALLRASAIDAIEVLSNA